MEKAHEIVTTGPPGHPAFPHANGFNGFLRALPGDRLCCLRRPRDHLASLTPASGRQDHTTSPSAVNTLVTCAITSIASRANVRDDRETPLGKRAGRTSR